MADGDLHSGADRSPGGNDTTDIQRATRTFGALNVVAGLLGLLGPAVWGNDDTGLVNTEPGKFLGLVTVNGPHALLHVVIGTVGVASSRDAGSARRYMGAAGSFFGLFAAVGWHQFGFEPGVHVIGGLAVDRWGTLGHVLLSALALSTAIRDSTE